tara:strand:- start:517 stop:2913 length:2397 start_codon:yes stop_codon:yes gene_type:complete
LVAALASVAAFAQEREEAEPYRVRIRFTEGVESKNLAGIIVTTPGSKSRPVSRGDEPEFQSGDPILSDNTGCAVFEVWPDENGVVEIHADHHLHAHVAWTWEPTGKTHDVDFGMVVLHPACRLDVYIKDEAGSALHNGWLVKVRGPVQPSLWASGENAPSMNVSQGQHEERLGAFRFHSLHSGEHEVWAQHRVSFRVERSGVRVKSTERKRVDLVHSGPDPDSVLAVTFRQTNGPRRSPRKGTVFAVDPRGGRHAMAPTEDRYLTPYARNTWHGSNLTNEAHEVLITDPRFEPVEPASGTPGEHHTIELRGTSGILFNVHGPDGTPVDGFKVEHARYRRLLGDRPQDSLSVDDGSAGLMDDLTAGSYTFTITAPGQRSTILEVKDLAAKEIREVSVPMSNAETLLVHVIDAHGQPVVARLVTLNRGDMPGHPRSMSGTVKGRFTVEGVQSSGKLAKCDSEQFTDEHGLARFDLQAPGLYTVAVRASTTSYQIRQVEIDPREPETELKIELPATRSLELELQIPAGTSLLGRTLRLQPKNNWVGSQEDFPMLSRTLNNTYEIHGVTSGEYTVMLDQYLELKHDGVRDSGTSFKGTSSINGMQDLGSIEVGGDSGDLMTLDCTQTLMVPCVIALTLPETHDGSGIELVGRNADGSRGGRIGPSICSSREVGWKYGTWATPGAHQLIHRRQHQGWVWIHPDGIDVRPNMPEVSVTVELLERRARILDHTGAPMTDMMVGYCSKGRWGDIPTISTDAEGYTESLSIPDGCVLRFSLPDTPDSYGELVWTKSNDAFTVTIPSR